MRILIVSATSEELDPFKQQLTFSDSAFYHKDHELEFLISGVGMVSTAYNLGKLLSLSEDFDLGINIGVAGSLNRSFDIGEVVNVKRDSIFEIGAEDGRDFISADKIGLADREDIVLESNKTINCSALNDLKTANGVTVNKVHGNKDTIDLLRKNNSFDIETMEGAAFFYSCKKAGLPAIQLRAISNYVEERNKNNWNLDLAINNLASTTMKLLQDLT